MGDLLQRVLDWMCIGVHGIDAPHIASVVVRGPAYAVERRVAHVDVGVGHVDLRAQRGGAVFDLTVAHLPEVREVLGGATGTERAVNAWRVEVAARGTHLVRRLLVHVGEPGGDQVLGGAVHEVKVIAGEVFMRLCDAGRVGAVGQVGLIT